MKKITFLFASLVIASVGFSQIATAFKGHTPLNTIKKNHNSSKTTNSFYIDYDAAEDNLWTPNYAWYIWDVKDYPSVVGDTATLNNFIVTFDSIYDYNTYTTYIPGVDYTNIKIDSIFFLGGHVNNSGQTNSIKVTVISLNASAYPQIATNLWDTVITTSTSLSTGGTWLNSFVITLAPNLTLPSSQKFGVKVEFQGMDTDTFGLLAGFQDGGACGVGTKSAVLSMFDRNTYSQWSDYNTYGLLPTASGANLYYDCNGDGSYNANSNEEDYLQNGSIWLHVTTDPSTGVDEVANNVNFIVYPNPGSGEFNINLTGNIENTDLTVKNIVGQTIMNKTINVSGKTQETISLAGYSKGIYFLTIDNETVKLVVE